MWGSCVHVMITSTWARLALFPIIIIIWRKEATTWKGHKAETQVPSYKLRKVKSLSFIILIIPSMLVVVVPSLSALGMEERTLTNIASYVMRKVSGWYVGGVGLCQNWENRLRRSYDLFWSLQTVQTATPLPLLFRVSQFARKSWGHMYVLLAVH